MRGTLDDLHKPVIANQEDAAEVIVTGLQATEPMMFRRHHAQVPANKCAFRGVQLPVTSVNPVTGPSPELVVALVLHRVHGGGVVTLGGDYLDHGLPAPGCLAGVFAELLDAGLLALADPDPDGRRRVTLTTAGHTRYEQLHGTPRPPGLPVPAPLFPTKTPAGRQLSSPAPLPAPGGQPDPRHQTGGSDGGPLRWARCPDDGRLHLLRPAEVVGATTGGHAEALCGRTLPAEGLTLAHGSAGALCLACLAGTSPGEQRPQPVLTTPGGC